ncbi:hypothetical protein CJP11_06470 [Salmonella enterica]|nr:hypothetical protein [Salmonella enterica subsp. arizonae]EAM4313603.1 hypothetical protein [Salmonella enterica]EAO9819551.1 hypothetical protein [Salmonella enterica]EAS8745106.1 hypothetical protein [Salmonella enterica]EBL7090174.1 hypothetical protein [Salmonella enterica]
MLISAHDNNKTVMPIINLPSPLRWVKNSRQTHQIESILTHFHDLSFIVISFILPTKPPDINLTIKYR